jgi:uncharacterized protein (TIGR01370 family)
MPLTNILFYILPSFLLSSFCRMEQKESKVLICYAKLKPESIKGYKTLIVEPKHYLPSNIRVFKKQNEEIYAYISFGEVNTNADHYTKVARYTTGKNEQWDSHYLNLESPKTVKVLLDLVAQIFASGYDGIFMDNIDNFTQYGPQKGQHDAVIQLIKKIKATYPTKKLMQNAGLELVPETAPFISSVAIESIASHYDFDKKKYKLSEEERFTTLKSAVLTMHNKYKKDVLLIEYADTPELKNSIKQRLEDLDCSLFVGTIDLQQQPHLDNN